MHPFRARKRLITAGLAAATMVALAGCGGSGSGGATSAAPAPSSSAAPSGPAEIRIAYQAIPNGDLVVKNLGLLEKALPGTTITWTKFESGGDVNTAVIAGAIDIGLAGSSPVTIGLAQPIPYQVPWIFDVIGPAESLVVRNDTGITDIKGLEGKKIGTPFASTAHYSLLAALEDAGITEDKVTLVDLQPPDILAAWQRGDIDAAYVWSPTLDELAKTGTILVTSAQVAEAGNPTYDLAVVTNAFSSAYPDAVVAWLRAQDEAVALLNNDPEAAAAAIAAELGITPEEALAQTKGHLSDAEEAQHIKDMRHLPAALQAVLALEPQLISWAEEFASKENALFLGRGTHYPIALEGALKLKEITYIHAEAYAAGELKHGPLALVTSAMPVVTVAPNDQLLEKLKSNLQEVRARGGVLYVLADGDTRIESSEGVNVIRMPEHYGVLSPILHVVPLQLLAYHTACARGTDVDKPRNLAKSVTVE